jgi:hypothetical protein
MESLNTLQNKSTKEKDSPEYPRITGKRNKMTSPSLDNNQIYLKSKDNLNDVNSDTYDSPSLFNKLHKLKQHHKNLISQLHIYNHKVNYYIEPYKKKTSSTSNPPPINLPSINNSQSHSNKIKFKSNQGHLTHPKFSLQEEKIKLQKMKENIQRNKEKKIQDAKEMKEANRLMRENVIVFKEKLKLENIQKKKIVDARFDLIDCSIKNYKMMKKNYIDSIYGEKVERELTEVFKKQNELKFLQITHENNMIKRNQDKKLNTLTSLNIKDQNKDLNSIVEAENNKEEISQLEKSEKINTLNHPNNSNMEKFLANIENQGTFITNVTEK